MSEPSYHKIRIEIEGPHLELFVNEMPIPVRALELSANMNAFPLIKAEIIPGEIPEPRGNLETWKEKAGSLMQMYYAEKGMQEIRAAHPKKEQQEENE